MSYVKQYSCWETNKNVMIQKFILTIAIIAFKSMQSQ